MLITTWQHLRQTHDAKKKNAFKTNKKDNPCWGYKQSGEGIGAEIHQLQLWQKVETEDLQAKGGPVGEKWTWLPVDEEGLTHKEGRESHKLQMKSEDLKSLMRRKNLTNLVMKENITTSMRRENPNNNKVVIYTNLERSELWTVHKQDNTPLSNDTPQQYWRNHQTSTWKKSWELLQW